jgi:hypothetical protein
MAPRERESWKVKIARSRSGFITFPLWDKSFRTNLWTVGTRTYYRPARESQNAITSDVIYLECGPSEKEVERRQALRLLVNSFKSSFATNPVVAEVWGGGKIKIVYISSETSTQSHGEF